jgi:trk system potassium uptake protein TrkH
MTKTFNWKIVTRTYGALLSIEALFMAVPTVVAYIYGDPDGGAFAVSTLITLVAGTLAMRIGRDAPRRVSEREGYLIVALVWLVFSAFGMLPFYLSGALDSITDSWFETMAGFSTMGATVIPNVEVMSHAILLWRALCQWLGGMGIIVLSVAVLPLFGLGGMQLYAAEVTGVSYEKLSPRINSTARLMWGTYIFLTVLETLLLNFFGMDLFDSVCHSMATISTGGFATHNDSVIAYSPIIQWIIFVFMLLSGINFTQLIYLFRGKPQRVIDDEETHWYLTACLIAGTLLAVGLLIHTHGMLSSVRIGLFTAVATITSTGFVAADYMIWPPVLWVLVFFLMFTGGASGSTSGGMKWVRLAIFAKAAHAEIKRRIHPNAVIPVRFNGRTLREQTTSNVVAFMFFYVLIIVLATLWFCGCGIGFDESFGIATSMIGNVGVSIGQWGSSGCYAAMPAAAKWVATFVMLIGRLEIFTVLLLFSSALWKK